MRSYSYFVDPAAMRRILKVTSLLRRRLKVKPQKIGSTHPGRLLAWAYPDRIAQRREGLPGRFLLAPMAGITDSPFRRVIREVGGWPKVRPTGSPPSASCDRSADRARAPLCPPPRARISGTTAARISGESDVQGTGRTGRHGQDASAFHQTAIVHPTSSPGGAFLTSPGWNHQRERSPG